MLYSPRPPQVIFDGLFLPPASLKSLAVTVAMPTFFASLDTKIASSKLSPLVAEGSIGPTGERFLEIGQLQRHAIA